MKMPWLSELSPRSAEVILGYAREQPGAAAKVMWMGETERMAKLMDECDKAKAANLQTSSVSTRCEGIRHCKFPRLCHRC